MHFLQQTQQTLVLFLGVYLVLLLQITILVIQLSVHKLHRQQKLIVEQLTI